jgi:transposase
LIIRLVYYPPYHSKYNAIRRFWAGLEKSWNGYLLDSKETVLKRAGYFVFERKCCKPYKSGFTAKIINRRFSKEPEEMRVGR